LLDLIAWQKAKPDMLRSLDLSDKPKFMLERWSKTLDAMYKRVERDLSENPHVTLKDVNGVLMPVVAPLTALPTSVSFRSLQQDVEQRLPEIDLSELILEINARTGFAREIIAASEGLPQAPDLEISVVAVLVAQACNLSLKQVAQANTPALTLSRLAQVKQNYLRTEGITQANARLVEYHASLPLTQRWGGGEVASADGLRFVVPIKSIHTAPNSKYFGVQRGITYYTLTSDQYSMLHGLVVPGTLRDSLFILATVLERPKPEGAAVGSRSNART
jgi:Tn3 transposase DDE domain